GLPGHGRPARRRSAGHGGPVCRLAGAARRPAPGNGAHYGSTRVAPGRPVAGCGLLAAATARAGPGARGPGWRRLARHLAAHRSGRRRHIGRRGPDRVADAGSGTRRALPERRHDAQPAERRGGCSTGRAGPASATTCSRPDRRWALHRRHADRRGAYAGNGRGRRQAGLRARGRQRVAGALCARLRQGPAGVPAARPRRCAAVGQQRLLPGGQQRAPHAGARRGGGRARRLGWADQRADVHGVPEPARAGQLRGARPTGHQGLAGRPRHAAL
ncbi:MAG: FIG00820636: hypothetical protein, partial [uncultured Blastococcus sp.]